MKIRKIGKLGRAVKAAAVAAVVLAATLKANGTTITFSGTFDSVGIFGGSDGIWDGLVPGTIGTLTVDFDGSGIDLSANPNVFVSTTSINNAQLFVGSHTLNFGSGAVTVLNDFAGGLDEFVLNLNPLDQTPGTTPDFDSLQFLYRDLAGTAFSSDSLGLSLTAINGRSGSLDLSGGGNEAHGEFTVSEAATAVPEAGSTGLLFAGAFGTLVLVHRLGRRNPTLISPSFAQKRAFCVFAFRIGSPSINR